MKLIPHETRERRVQKVVTHYFDHRERWWDVTGGDFLAWQEAWTTVRASNALAEPEGWRNVLPDTPADEVVAKGYIAWFAAAQVACDQAKQRATVFVTGPDRSSFVGELGITVVVASRREDDFIVTAWRVTPRWGISPETLDAADRKAIEAARRKSTVLDRAAVRRSHRHASYVRALQNGSLESSDEE